MAERKISEMHKRLEELLGRRVETFEEWHEKAIHEEKMIEFINRKRRQILVHSCLYYEFDQSIIDDDTYTMWARELYEAQELYPEIASKCIFAREFMEFDYCTGYNLPFRHPDVVKKATELLDISTRYSS